MISHNFTVHISFRYIRYIEGQDSIDLALDPSAGNDPSIVYVPTAQAWHHKMPTWARTRRDELLSRITTACKHLNLEWKEFD